MTQSNKLLWFSHFIPVIHVNDWNKIAKPEKCTPTPNPPLQSSSLFFQDLIPYLHTLYAMLPPHEKIITSRHLYSLSLLFTALPSDMAINPTL